MSITDTIPFFLALGDTIQFGFGGWICDWLEPYDYVQAGPLFQGLAIQYAFVSDILTLLGCTSST
jgi:hypothetical protein